MSSCVNTTADVPLVRCAAGYYCPFAATCNTTACDQAFPCSAGNYCPNGTIREIQCPFVPLTTCPTNKLSYPSEWALVGFMLLILAAMLVLMKVLAYKFFENDKLVHKKVDQSEDLMKEQKELMSKTEHMVRSSVTRMNISTEEEEYNVEESKNRVNLESVASMWDQLSIYRNSSAGDMPGEASPITNPSTSNKFSFNSLSQPHSIILNHVTLTLKDSGKRILNDLSAVISPGQLTAVMGPSGGGKTTLLSVLRGEASYAHTTGEVLVGGIPINAATVSLIGYVPQDDIMYEELTVQDNIMFTALLCNARGYTTVLEVMPMVDHILDVLGITFIRQALVGSPGNRGISGGQKKRVSIGMELVKEALVFVLDEPTSGLDSTSSLTLAITLHRLARLGVNVISTLHQPRTEIIEVFDKILLLAFGGYIVFYGTPKDMMTHFVSYGFPCPLKTNTGDFVMDVLGGLVAPITTVKRKAYVYSGRSVSIKNVSMVEDAESEGDDVETTVGDLPSLIEVRDMLYEGFVQEFGGASELSLQQALKENSKKVVEDSKSGNRAILIPLHAAHVFSVCLHRKVVMFLRKFNFIILGCANLFFFGFFIANLFGPISYNPSQQLMSGALVFAIVTQALYLQHLQSEQLIRNREIEAGVPIISSFWGKVVGSWLEFSFFSLAYLAAAYPFFHTWLPIGTFWVLKTMLLFAISGFVNLVYACSQNQLSSMISCGTVIALWSYGGVSPTTYSIESSLGVVGLVINHLSLFKYYFESIAPANWQEHPHQVEKVVTISGVSALVPWWPTDFLYNYFDYPDNPNPVAYGVLTLFIYGIITNALACIVFILRRKFRF